MEMRLYFLVPSQALSTPLPLVPTPGGVECGQGSTYQIAFEPRITLETREAILSLRGGGGKE